VRIAQIAPLTESIPPCLHGGKGRAISYLTEALHDLGHRVTLFASGDSLSQAELIAGCSRVLAEGSDPQAIERAHQAMLYEAYERRAHFDVIHLHLDGWQRLCPPLLETCHLTTVHGFPDAQLRSNLDHPRLRLIAVSEAQRDAFSDGPWLGSVPHGLPDGFCRPCYEPGRYLVFMGRICRDRGIEQAIEIATSFGMPLRVAGRIERSDHAYYRSQQTRWRASGVEYLGELDELHKDELLAGAFALLYPGRTTESFPLAVTEAMQCGTPVITFRHSGVDEVVDEGVTGFAVDDPSGAVAALHRVRQLDRSQVTYSARRRYSARRMARDYLRWYARSISQDLSGPISLGEGMGTEAAE
jgi:glycosyltransferase involved in cell wall biosynthesis